MSISRDIIFNRIKLDVVMKLLNLDLHKNIIMQTAMFIYKSMSRCHRFYDYSQLRIESETEQLINIIMTSLNIDIIYTNDILAKQRYDIWIAAL